MAIEESDFELTPEQLQELGIAKPVPADATPQQMGFAGQIERARALALVFGIDGTGEEHHA